MALIFENNEAHVLGFYDSGRDVDTLETITLIFGKQKTFLQDNDWLPVDAVNANIVASFSIRRPALVSCVVSLIRVHNRLCVEYTHTRGNTNIAVFSLRGATSSVDAIATPLSQS